MAGWIVYILVLKDSRLLTHSTTCYVATRPEKESMVTRNAMIDTLNSRDV